MQQLFLRQQQTLKLAGSAMVEVPTPAAGSREAVRFSEGTSPLARLVQVVPTTDCKRQTVLYDRTSLRRREVADALWTSLGLHSILLREEGLPPVG